MYADDSYNPSDPEFHFLLSTHLSFPLIQVHHVGCQKHKLKFDESEKSSKISTFFREPQNKHLVRVNRVISAKIRKICEKYSKNGKL